jgi:hypothetical protein
MKMSKKLVEIMLVFVLLCLTTAVVATDNTGDLYSQYLSKNVTVLVCNETYYQGIMIAWSAEAISIREMCNPELGIVTINKYRITSIREGYDCYEFYR